MKPNAKNVMVVTEVITMCIFPGARKSSTSKGKVAKKTTESAAAAVSGKKEAEPAEDKGAGTVPLTLIVHNLASTTAPVIVGVYGTKNKFPDPKDQLKEYKFKPKGKVLTAKITNLKFGTYALALYQDVDNNGKINKNFIGVPTEPYAFSRNYKPKVKAPDFDDCKFDYSAKSNKLSLTMIK